MAKTSKIVTISMDELSIKRLDALQDFLHLKNKSRILCNLVDAEYRRQLVLREEEDSSRQ